MVVFFVLVFVVEVLLYIHRNRRFIRDGSPDVLDFHTAPDLFFLSIFIFLYAQNLGIQNTPKLYK